MTQNKRYTSRIGTAALAALLLTAASAAWAGSAVDAPGYGSADVWLSGEIAALGGTGVAADRGGFGTVLNPATLSAAGAWRLDAGAALAQDHEDRFQPLFDSFGSYVTDTAIASNRHHYLDAGFAVARSFGEGFGLGLSLTERYDFAYDFEEQVRDPDSFSDPRDRILEERSLSSSGALRDLALGAGYALNERVSLGLTAHYLFTDLEGAVNRRVFENPGDTYSMDSTLDADGFGWTAGILVEADERFTLGASVETAVDIEGDLETVTASGADLANPVGETVGRTFSYPKQYRMGLAYHPRSEPRTVVTLEMVWTEWTQFEDDGTKVFDENTRDYRVGVEHVFYNGMPVRFGFRHFDLYADTEASASLFSAGIGMPYGGGMFDVSAQLGKVSSVQEHWFPYPEDFETVPTARVEDNRFRLGATFIYRF